MRRLTRDPLVLAVTISMPVWLLAQNMRPHVRQQTCGSAPEAPDRAHARAGTAHLPGGVFFMGATPVRDEEGPRRPMRVAPFSIDRTEVTNAQFARFVAETGYRTLAERGLDEAHFPGLPPRDRVTASLVVEASPGVDLPDPGADWRHPLGPGSSIEGQDQLPVAQIAYADALAYARWAGRDLPGQAEWGSAHDCRRK